MLAAVKWKPDQPSFAELMPESWAGKDLAVLLWSEYETLRRRFSINLLDLWSEIQRLKTRIEEKDNPMPLTKGYSKKSIAKNTAAEIRAGKDPAQAVAIAHSVARKAKAKAKGKRKAKKK